MIYLCFYVLWPVFAFVATLAHNPLAFELRECAAETDFHSAYVAHLESIDWNAAIDAFRKAQIETESADLIARLSSRPAYSANRSTLAYFGVN